MLNTWMFNLFVLPILVFISLLPFPVLYFLSDGLYLLIFHVVGYRKKVVFENLRKSFPEKNESEINTIASQFYRHLCDTIFETLKVYTISKKSFARRCVFDEQSKKHFDYFIQKNTSIVCVLGHCGNWEWISISHQITFKHLLTVVYHPLSNKNFDTFMLKLRSRFGGDMVPMHGLYKRLLTLKKEGVLNTIGMVGDQTAPPESSYWTTFLNQDTPVFFGSEKLAKKFNYPMMYLSIKKTKRGYYTVSSQIISETPNTHPDGELTEIHTRLLEKDIRETPYSWLWSHRRWKHKKPLKS